MNFAHPWLLLLLLALPLLAWLRGRAGKPAAFTYSSVRLLQGLSALPRSRAGAFLAALRWLALAGLIVALAQPRFSRSETSVVASGIDIVVALDMSGSMMAQDFEIRGTRVDRLTMAKNVTGQFIEKRPSDRIGLVTFATEAYLAAPLTLDHDFLRKNLDRLQFGVIEDTRTAIGSALTAALNRLRELQSKSKIVILMTDGQSNAGKIPPLTVAEAAKALGIKVYTIGVGTRGVAPMPVYDQAGRLIGYQQQRVDIDEETLTKIADMTGGKYYRADNAERFARIYAEIDKLEKTEVKMSKFAEHRELFALAIAPGVLLLLLEVLLRHTVLRRLP
jgi:Ca-activated chloride channel family protein